MTETLEDALARAIRSKVEDTPAAPADLTARIRGLRSRRRRRRQLACTAAAVVLAVGGTTFALRGADGQDQTPIASVSAAPYKKLAKPEPIERVWPQAVHRVPKTIKGHKILPLTFLDEGRLLISTWTPSKKTYSLFVHNLKTGRATKINDFVFGPETTTLPTGFAVGDGYVAFWTAEGKRVSIWSQSLSGAPGGTVATYSGPPGDRVGELVITGGKVRWSSSTEVHEAPASSDRSSMSQVPGSWGHNIVVWPWIGSPPPGAGRGGFLFNRDLVNVETGERRTSPIKVAGSSMTCGVAWCYDKAKAMTRDGSRTIALPHGISTPPGAPTLDRFLVAGNPAVHLLIDLRTGRTATVPKLAARDTTVPGGTISPNNRMFQQETRDAYLLIDLGSISD